ncbi:hypothetical protein [Ammoniphilus resinae]|uniref:Uncharacterized protein n=1 Tax=Ammoniphilus resinae TaxID=861532 RepID=A0ABS4GSY8_9BACL|nr:hypothetical protein [Ammoniphilus resinae]MBP1933371.1 hypothetical protein [Ammoniphilus resinae]
MEDYQSFLEGLFICGEIDVPTVIDKEKANFIVDVRAEAKESAGGQENRRVNIPLEASKPNQSKELKEAIDQLVAAYKKGEKAVLH